MKELISHEICFCLIMNAFKEISVISLPCFSHVTNDSHENVCDLYQKRLIAQEIMMYFCGTSPNTLHQKYSSSLKVLCFRFVFIS